MKINNSIIKCEPPENNSITHLDITTAAAGGSMATAGTIDANQQSIVAGLHQGR